MNNDLEHEAHANVDQAASVAHSMTQNASNAANAFSAAASKAFDVGGMMSQGAKAMEAPMASMREAQERSRESAEKTLAETRAQYGKIKAAAEEATTTMEATLDAVKTSMIDFNVKAIEAWKTNADSSFNFLKSLASSGSMAEVVTLQSEFARKQFDAISEQGKTFATLARQVADKTVEPIKAQMGKAMHINS